MIKPPCFDTQEQYDGWVELATEAGIEEPEKNYCIDCLPVLKAYAISLGECTFPRTFFIDAKDEDGEDFVFGVAIPAMV